MENFFSRYRKETVLVALLFAQMIALATQVKVRVKNVDPMLGPVAAQEGGTRLIRVWAMAMVSPFQRAAVNTGLALRGVWHNYVDLRSIRSDNEQLQAEVNRLRMEQVRMQEDAQQGRRLQALLGFKEQFPSQTVAAEVIGTSGTEMSRVVYVNRGSSDGIAAGMAVITPDGVVGKVTRADRSISQILLINDPTSGAGVMLERLRLNGILKGTAGGYPEILYVMADEKIQTGDRVLTTGGDRVFPKGMLVGTVESVVPDRERDPFLAIRVKPAVNLSRLEEVLIITQVVERTPQVAEGTSGPMRAADMLAQRLPSVPKKDLLADPNANKLTVPGAAASTAAETPAKPAVTPTKPPSSPATTSAASATAKKSPDIFSPPLKKKLEETKPAEVDTTKETPR